MILTVPEIIIFNKIAFVSVRFRVRFYTVQQRKFSVLLNQAGTCYLRPWIKL